MAIKKQNHELSLAKFIFAIIILIYHSKMIIIDDSNPILLNGWSATEFFFIVSGFLMVFSARKYSEKPIGTSTLDFIVKKIKSIYPFYIMAFLLSFAVRQFSFNIQNYKITNTVLGDFIISINELLMLQNSGIAFTSIYNGPTWYLSAMIIAMTILFPLLLKFKDWFINIGSLTISISVYAFLAQNSVAVNDTTTWIHFTTQGMLRAFAGLSLGVFLYGLVDKIKQKNFTLKKNGQVLMFLSEIGAFTLLIWIMQNLPKLKGKRQFDYIMIIIIVYICFVIFSELTQINNILPAKICSFLGKLSLPIYLLHRAVIYFYLALEINLPFKYYSLLYFGTTVVLVIVAHLVLYICGLVRKKFGSTVHKFIFGTNNEQIN